ncbi:MAG TPA: 3-deoxy-8-phosphooctulonate synthase [Terriglobales bacterium]|nr:3-deoxy-8-phosphooctulonate synthase [Terriglobales bacterium]
MAFQVGGVRVGSGRLFLIAGPCVIESEAHALHMARAIAAVARSANMPFIFKASYDKANRTSLGSFRGPGLEQGARILGRIRDEVAVPVLTDVHEPAQAERIAAAVDVLQIPAFLCRQTDLLMAAAKTGKAVNIKKGQFVAPWDMQHAVEKIRSAGNDRVFLTERGSSFGYNNLVVDMRSLAIMRRFAPVVFDGTHSVQLPSAGAPARASAPGDSASESANSRQAAAHGNSAPDVTAVSGGQPEFIPVLSRAAVAAGVDGIFLEVHDDPAQAKSDAANALDLKLLPDLLRDLLAIHSAAGSAVHPR